MENNKPTTAVAKAVDHAYDASMKWYEYEAKCKELEEQLAQVTKERDTALRAMEIYCNQTPCLYDMSGQTCEGCLLPYKGEVCEYDSLSLAYAIAEAEENTNAEG